jgi:hypothetical protein
MQTQVDELGTEGQEIFFPSLPEGSYLVIPLAGRDRWREM